MKLKKIIALQITKQTRLSVWEKLVDLFRHYLFLRKTAPSKPSQTAEKEDEVIELEALPFTAPPEYRPTTIKKPEALPTSAVNSPAWERECRERKLSEFWLAKTYDLQKEDIHTLIQQFPSLTTPQLHLRVWLELVYDLPLLDILTDPKDNPWHSEYTYKTLEQDLEYLTSLRWFKQRRVPSDILLLKLTQAQLRAMPQERDNAEDCQAFLTTMIKKIEVYIPSRKDQLPTFQTIFELVKEKTIKESLFVEIINLLSDYLYDPKTRNLLQSGFMDTLSFTIGEKFLINHPCVEWVFNPKRSGIILETVNFRRVLFHILLTTFLKNTEAGPIKWIIIWNIMKNYFQNKLNQLDLYILFTKLIESTELKPEHQIRFMREFLTLTKGQLTADTIGMLIIVFSQQKNASITLIDYLIAPYEKILVHMDLALFTNVREALLTSLHEENIDPDSALILEHLYDQVFLKKWDPNLKMFQSELEALLCASKISQSRKTLLISKIKAASPNGLRLDADSLNSLEKRIRLLGYRGEKTESEWAEIGQIVAYLREF